MSFLTNTSKLSILLTTYIVLALLHDPTCHISINVDKTKCMFFYKRRPITPLQFSMNNRAIDVVENFNYLDIILDSNMSWKSHIAMVRNKLSRINRILHRLKYLYPQNILITLYKSLFIPYINYGLLLWGQVGESLDTIQKKAIRTITYSHYIAHSEPLLKELNLLKVQDLFQLKILKFLFKLYHNKLPPYFNICNTSTRPEVRRTADVGAYSISVQSSSYTLTNLSSHVSTNRRAVTDMNGKTPTLRCAPFLCRLRRRECCMLGAPSSQPMVPLHKLPPARLVIHRQTSAHERRKWTRSVQSRSGILAYLCIRQHWLWITVELHTRRAPRGGCCLGERLLRSCTPSFGLETAKP